MSGQVVRSNPRSVGWTLAPFDGSVLGETRSGCNPLNNFDRYNIGPLRKHAIVGDSRTTHETMKLKGLKGRLFDTFRSDQIRRMHHFIGGANPSNANGITYSGDSCTGGSACAEGYRDDLGTADAVSSDRCSGKATRSLCFGLRLPATRGTAFLISAASIVFPSATVWAQTYYHDYTAIGEKALQVRQYSSACMSYENAFRRYAGFGIDRVAYAKALKCNGEEGACLEQLLFAVDSLHTHPYADALKDSCFQRWERPEYFISF